jgi:hypothetical protein
LAIVLAVAGHGGDGLFGLVFVAWMGWRIVRDLGAIGEARDRQLQSFQTVVTSVDPIRTALDQVTVLLATLCTEAAADGEDELRDGIDLIRQFWSAEDGMLADRWDDRAGVEAASVRAFQRSSEAEVFMTTIEALNRAYRSAVALLGNHA